MEPTLSASFQFFSKVPLFFMKSYLSLVIISLLQRNNQLILNSRHVVNFIFKLVINLCYARTIFEILLQKI